MVCFYCFYKCGIGEREKSKDIGEHVASKLERDGNAMQREGIRALRSITEPCTEAWTVIVLSFILGPSRLCLQEYWEIDCFKMYLTVDQLNIYLRSYHINNSS